MIKIENKMMGDCESVIVDDGVYNSKMISSVIINLQALFLT